MKRRAAQRARQIAKSIPDRKELLEVVCQIIHILHRPIDRQIAKAQREIDRWRVENRRAS